MSVPATEAKNFRRETADSSVPIRLRRPFGLATLDNVMHEIAGHHRALALREDVDAAMTGRMPRRRRQCNGIVERVIVVNQNRLSGFHDGQAIVAKHRTGRIGALGMLGLPDRIFSLVKYVFGVRERRHPAPVAQRGIPAGMVDVQMGAEHVVHLLVGDAERKQLVSPSLLAGKSNGGGWPLSSPVQVSTRMV